MAAKIVTFNLNGREIDVLVKPLTTMQTLLRDQLEYFATKSGCRQGGCGSCTILVDGSPWPLVIACRRCRRQRIDNAGGHHPKFGLHPIQEAFFDNYAMQCGYCTPGIIMVSKALLDRNPHPNRQEIVEAWPEMSAGVPAMSPLFKRFKCGGKNERPTRR